MICSRERRCAICLVPIHVIGRIAFPNAESIRGVKLLWLFSLSAQVVLFGLPGAFTPVCSGNHVPGFISNADAIRAKGVDEIVCVTPNDWHVTKVRILGGSYSAHSTRCFTLIHVPDKMLRFVLSRPGRRTKARVTRWLCWRTGTGRSSARWTWRKTCDGPAWTFAPIGAYLFPAWPRH